MDAHQPARAFSCRQHRQADGRRKQCHAIQNLVQSEPFVGLRPRVLIRRCIQGVGSAEFIRHQQVARHAGGQPDQEYRPVPQQQWRSSAVLLTGVTASSSVSSTKMMNPAYKPSAIM